MNDMQITKHFTLRELTTTDIEELKEKNYEEGRLKLYELCKVDVRVAHDQGGDVSLTTIFGSLNAFYISDLTL